MGNIHPILVTLIHESPYLVSFDADGLNLFKSTLKVMSAACCFTEVVLKPWLVPDIFMAMQKNDVG
jgi:hypothetical protein